MIRKNENHDAKNKDGNGNKRKNRRENGDSLTSGDVRILASPRKHFQHIEEFVAHEEILLNGFFNVLSQVTFSLRKNCVAYENCKKKV